MAGPLKPWEQSKWASQPSTAPPKPLQIRKPTDAYEYSAFYDLMDKQVSEREEAQRQKNEAMLRAMELLKTQSEVPYHVTRSYDYQTMQFKDTYSAEPLKTYTLLGNNGGHITTVNRPLVKTTGKYILEGRTVKPCDDLLTWAEWFEQTANRIIDVDHVQDVSGEVRVSTVFLGIDHSFGDGEPLLFESMVFGGTSDQYQERYTTIEAAEAGHKRILTIVKAGGKP